MDYEEVHEMNKQKEAINKTIKIDERLIDNCAFSPLIRLDNKLKDSINKLNYKDILLFMMQLDSVCLIENIEYSEMTNELLFESISINEREFLVAINLLNGMNENMSGFVYKELEYPLSDKYDLKTIKTRLLLIKDKDMQELRDRVIHSLDASID